MAIPKVIHYCWFGGKDLPQDVKRCIESWKKYCPDYELVRWDESNYDYGKYLFTKGAYNSKKWAFVSDVARLDVIYQYGGFYLDTDVELVKSLDSLLDNEAFMGFEKGRLVATGLGFGAEKGNKVIKANLDLYKDMIFENSDESLKQKSCPIITTNYLDTIGLIRQDIFQALDGIKIYPSEFFCPMLLSDGTAEIKENTISIHHYAGTWITDEHKKIAIKRVDVYTKYGRMGLRIYNGYVLLRKQGIGVFCKKVREKLSDFKGKFS